MYSPPPLWDITRPMQITSKHQMYRLLKAGILGNTLRTWETLDEYLSDGAPRNVALRTREQGGPFIQNLSPSQVKKHWSPRFFISEHAPDYALTLQGEVQQSPNYIDLFCSTQSGYTMRDGLRKHGRMEYGYRAVSLMKINMDPGSFEWINILLNDHPDSVIEFSCYPWAVGKIPNRNTLIWEVRTGY